MPLSQDIPIHSVWSPGLPFTGKACASEDEHRVESTNYRKKQVPPYTEFSAVIK